jgi:hypothetical protein
MQKVILEGSNFGNDPEQIKVYFNRKQGKVIGSTGTRMYAVVPRLPGDTCTVTVVVGSDSLSYESKFRYIITSSVSTITGTGNTNPLKTGTLAEAQFQANYLCVDNEKNIFVVSTTGGGTVLKVNEEENTVIKVSDNAASGGINGETAPVCIKETGSVFITARMFEESFWLLEPRAGWVAKTLNVTWDQPSWGRGPRCGVAYCELDGMVYVPYWNNGETWRINPVTLDGIWTKATGVTGNIYGVAFHPIQKHLLYEAYSEDASQPHRLYILNIQTNEHTLFAGSGISGHRDGELDVARFNDPRQMAFDEDGNLYIADKKNYCIRKITTDNKVETVIGMPGVSGFVDGSKEEALLTDPTGIAIDSEGTIYIADGGRLRKLAIE